MSFISLSHLRELPPTTKSYYYYICIYIHTSVCASTQIQLSSAAIIHTLTTPIWLCIYNSPFQWRLHLHLSLSASPLPSLSHGRITLISRLSPAPPCRSRAAVRIRSSSSSRWTRSRRCSSLRNSERPVSISSKASPTSTARTISVLRSFAPRSRSAMR